MSSHHESDQFSREKFQRDLRDICAELYPDKSSMRRVLDDAGIKWADINLDESPRNSWHAIINEAINQGQLPQLIEIVCSEYPNNPNLAEYDRFIDSGGVFTTIPSDTIDAKEPAPDESGFSSFFDDLFKNTNRWHEQGQDTR
ncbi:MAG: hypothetical protein KDE19_20335, partial [Caldilineaceae bacterium]|nr:hypothetical protein [Caldilineaceae bacterium]